MSTKKRNNIIHLFLSRLIRRIKGFKKRIDHTAAKRAANVTGKYEDVTKRRKNGVREEVGHREPLKLKS